MLWSSQDFAYLNWEHLNLPPQLNRFFEPGHQCVLILHNYVCLGPCKRRKKKEKILPCYWRHSSLLDVRDGISPTPHATYFRTNAGRMARCISSKAIPRALHWLAHSNQAFPFITSTPQIVSFPQNCLSCWFWGRVSPNGEQLIPKDFDTVDMMYRGLNTRFWNLLKKGEGTREKEGSVSLTVWV